MKIKIKNVYNVNIHVNLAARKRNVKVASFLKIETKNVNAILGILIPIIKDVEVHIYYYLN